MAWSVSHIEYVDPQPVLVSEAEIKRALRIDGSEFDTELADILQDVRADLEGMLNQFLYSQDVRITYDRFAGAMILPVWPLREVRSVLYTDANGAEQTLDPSKYTLRQSVTPRELVPAYGQSWPVTLGHVDDVRITARVGYAGSLIAQTEPYNELGAVPSEIQSILRRMVVQRFQNKGEYVTGAGIARPPAGVIEAIKALRFMP